MTQFPHSDNPVSQDLATSTSSFWPTKAVNSLCPEQEKHTMREPEVQIGNSGFIETKKEIPA
jgi:hypothetical protein